MNHDFETYLIKLAYSKISSQPRMLVKLNKFLKTNQITLSDLNEAGKLINFEWKNDSNISPILREITEDWATLLISHVYLANGKSPFDQKVIEGDLASFVEQVAMKKHKNIDSAHIKYIAYEIFEDIEDDVIEILNKFQFDTNKDIIVTGITPDLKIIVADRDVYGYTVEDNIPDVLEDLDTATIEPYV